MQEGPHVRAFLLVPERRMVMPKLAWVAVMFLIRLFITTLPSCVELMAHRISNALD